MALLLFKPEWWVICHKPQTLEDAISLMEVYMSAEAGIYLQKNLQKQAAQAEQGKTTDKGNGRMATDTHQENEHRTRGAPPEPPTPIFNWLKPKG